MNENPILVVEDDLTTSRLYQMHFRRHAIRAAFFTRGTEAIQHATEFPPPLAVLDYELPDMPGIRVLEKLLALPAETKLPVIFVTGRASPETTQNLREAGADVVLGKPFSPLELIREIRSILDVLPAIQPDS
jgi:DNA-binding response OmpR family regulator